MKYKNDPTITAWDLANEPRCICAGITDVRTVNIYVGGGQEQWIDAVTVS